MQQCLAVDCDTSTGAEEARYDHLHRHSECHTLNQSHEWHSTVLLAQVIRIWNGTLLEEGTPLKAHTGLGAQHMPH